MLMKLPSSTYRAQGWGYYRSLMQGAGHAINLGSKAERAAYHSMGEILLTLL